MSRRKRPFCVVIRGMVNPATDVTNSIEYGKKEDNKNRSGNPPLPQTRSI
jgi:hypothetical protein